MSVGGAEATAPPIFSVFILFFIPAAHSRTCRATRRQKLRSIYCKPQGVVEDFREKFLPYCAFVRPGLVFRSDCDLLRSECVSRGGSRICFTGQKEKQIQEQEVEETKSFERPPPQTQWKTRVGLIFSEIRWRTRSGAPRRFLVSPSDRDERRTTWKYRLEMPFYRMVPRHPPIGRLAFPGKNQNGEPSGSPF